MAEVQTITLQALENRAEGGLERAESGWRQFTEAMRDIKESEAYKEEGYRYFRPYYREKWEQRARRSWSTMENNLSALRSIEEMEEVLDCGGGLPVPGVLPTPSADAAQTLRAAFPDPAERVSAWEHHLEAKRPIGRDRGGLYESIREFKGEPLIEKEPTVRETLSPEDMADLPSPNLSAQEKWAFETGKIAAALRRLTPADVAAQAVRLMPQKVDWEVDAAKQIVEWYEAYQRELQTQKNQRPRRVK